MNCVNHPERNAAAFCRQCGKAMCEECSRPALGSVFCDEHLPASARPPQPPPMPDPFRQPEGGYANSPYQASSASSYQASPAPGPYGAPAPQGPPPDPGVHPALALILGFLPGVGAIYNGQYAKGLIHAVIFGLMISIVSSTHSGAVGAFVGIMIGIWVIYQAFEAYHTARKRRYGIAVDEFSSLIDVGTPNGRFPFGAALLIGVGFILLLDTTDIISMDVFLRYWPILLIGVGLYMLYARLNPRDHQNGNAEVRR